jgi:hypothetical protein
MTETIIVSTRENTFKFVNEFWGPDKSFYTIHVEVQEKLYKSGKSYYDISYIYEFEGNEKSRMVLHPFYSDEDEKILDAVAEGVIVYKNKMTEIMIEYLLLDSEELEKITNLITAQSYRKNIMLSLAKFWD